MENFSNRSIDIDSLPNFEEVDYQTISSKYLVKSNIQTTIFLVIVLVGWTTFFYYQASITNLTMQWLPFSFILVSDTGIIIRFRKPMAMH